MTAATFGETSSMKMTNTTTAAVRDLFALSRCGVAAGVVVGVVVLLSVVSPAFAVYGDDYGAAPINGHPDAIQEAPAVSGEHAFWAGACDRGSAPGFGVDMSGVGNGTGVGSRVDSVVAATGKAVFPRVSPPILAQVLAPATVLPEHCLDYGAVTLYQYREVQQGRLWQQFPYDTGQPFGEAVGETVGQELPSDCLFPAGESWTAPVPPYPDEWADFPDHCDRSPRWRLPAETRAGSHPDGTTMLAWNRNEEGVGTSPGGVDGSVDNIRVDLPPGFVGNPQAVAQCSNEQFREKPLLCPPQSQVGLLRLNLQGDCVGTPCNIPGTYDTTYPVYNLEPREGRIAELGFGYAADFAAVRLVADARTSGDFGVTAFAGQVPAALVPISQQITLWGVPWAGENDVWRTKLGHFEGPLACRTTAGFTSAADEVIPPSGLAAGCEAGYEPGWGEVKPFLTNETDCNPAPTVRLATDAYQNPGRFTVQGDPDLPAYPQLLTGAAADQSGWKTYSSLSPAVTGCGDLDFAPDLDLEPTSQSADGAAGLKATLAVPQNDRPQDVDGDVLDPGAPGYLAAASAYWDSDAGRGSAHLKDSVVTLPAGVSLNPSAATGLEACSDAGIGLRDETDAATGRRLFNDGDPFNGSDADGAECPDSSRIGTARVDVPLLADPLLGEVVLGTPETTNPRGDGTRRMFRLFIVVRDPHRGLIAKIYGSSTADGTIGEGGSGQLVTVFENNPEVPFDSLELDIKGGDKGLLALPPRCGAPGWASTFTPWSASGGGDSVDNSDSFTVNDRCAFGFSPGLVAGMSGRDARASGVFSLRLTRPEGDQTVSGLTVGMPQGLLASVRGVPLCPHAAGDTGVCGEGSRIGSVDGAAGSGVPFVLEKKGSVYLTEGYKGAPYGLSVVVPVEAGPFKGALALKTIVVRAAVQVDRRTAQVTVVSDPLPQVWHGIPLRVREILATVDRPDFMRNPSGCTTKHIVTDLSSPQGATASPSSPYQATNCARLGFKPKLKLRLTGRRQMTTNKHPGIRAQVTQTSTEAGIQRAEVRLPKTLALDPDNAQALCEFADGTKPDLENHCPKGSIVGRAKAVSPLLNRPLSGNVYFVKNVRTDPRTGNQIRTLPMIIAALRGEIAINLRGESNVKNQKLVNTFSAVPDAPVSRFNLKINGGKNGILAVTRTRKNPRVNLCNKRQTAITRIKAHNNRTHNPRTRMTTTCPNKKRSNRKRT